jgi:hypothetical protein
MSTSSSIIYTTVVGWHWVLWGELLVLWWSWLAVATGQRVLSGKRPNPWNLQIIHTSWDFEVLLAVNMKVMWQCVLCYMCSDVGKDLLALLHDTRIKSSCINSFNSHVSELLCYFHMQVKLITENIIIRYNMHTELCSIMIWQHIWPVLSSSQASCASLASYRSLYSTLYHIITIKFKMYNYKHIKNITILFYRWQFCGTWCHVVS